MPLSLVELWEHRPRGRSGASAAANRPRAPNGGSDRPPPTSSSTSRSAHVWSPLRSRSDPAAGLVGVFASRRASPPARHLPRPPWSSSIAGCASRGRRDEPGGDRFERRRSEGPQPRETCPGGGESLRRTTGRPWRGGPGLDYRSSISGQDYWLISCRWPTRAAGSGVRVSLDVTERTVVEPSSDSRDGRGALSEAMRALAEARAHRPGVPRSARARARSPGHRSRRSWSLAPGSGLEAMACVGAELTGLVLPLAGELSRAARIHRSRAGLRRRRRRRGRRRPGFFRRTGASSCSGIRSSATGRDRRPGRRLAAAGRGCLPASPLIDLLAPRPPWRSAARTARQLDQLARTDDLTGRRTADLGESCPGACSAWRDTTVCVAMLDLDRFKLQRPAATGRRRCWRRPPPPGGDARPYDFLAATGARSSA